MKKITVEAIVRAPIEKVWDTWTKPEHIVKWAFASDDWEARSAENDVQVDGVFKTVMAAKDNSASFDFTGKYTAVEQHKRIEYVMDDGREVKIEFTKVSGGVLVKETFDPESENTLKLQREGWQAILDNFKKYTESIA